jgi:hypothetical protein
MMVLFSACRLIRLEGGQQPDLALPDTDHEVAATLCYLPITTSVTRAYTRW